jgi:RNA polymerase sigma-70 factor, ECF subfamily
LYVRIVWRHIMLHTLNDGQLIALHEAGDPDAFEEIDRRYRAPLTAFVGQYMGDDLSDAVEDIVQLTFLEAHKARSRLKGPTIKAWLYRAAISAIHNHRAQENALKRGPGRTAPLLSDPISREPSPVETAARRETAELVTLALGRLPAVERDVAACLVADLTREKTARQQSIPLGTAKGRATRAKQHLAAMLRGLEA